MANNEEFQDVLRRQYSEEIHEAYLECEHGEGQIDYAKLFPLLGTLLKRAKVDGLSAKDFVELVQSTLPPEVSKAPGFAELAGKVNPGSNR